MVGLDDFEGSSPTYTTLQLCGACKRKSGPNADAAAEN